MKKLIVWTIILAISFCVYKLMWGAEKQVVYDKVTKQAIAVKVSENPSNKDTARKDIVCENGIILYGTPEGSDYETIAIDDKSIPADIAEGKHKVDTDKKEIYKEIILGDE